MVTLTLPVSTPTPVGQVRLYTFLWYQEIPSVGGVQRNQFSRPLLGLGSLTTYVRAEIDGILQNSDQRYSLL